MLNGGLKADFYQDKIYLNSKPYPLGLFTVELLNDYYTDETGARFSVFSSKIDNVKDDLQAGFIFPQTCFEVKEKIPHILKAAKKILPFGLLNLDEEAKNIDALFSDGNIKALKEYFALKASFLPNNDIDLDLILKQVSSDDREQLILGENLLMQFCNTLDFYQNLADDYRLAFSMFVEFEKRIDEAKRCDEYFLATTAMDIYKSGFKPIGFGYHSDFKQLINADIEYLAIKKSGASKKLITARRMHFKRFIDFILADFYEGVSKGHYPKKCLVCGRYFLMQNARKQFYCNGRDPNDKKNRPCRMVAADRRRGIRDKENRENNPITFIFNRAAANIRKNYGRGTFNEKQRKEAVRYIKNLRFKARSDTDFLNNEYEKQMSIKTIKRIILNNK